MIILGVVLALALILLTVSWCTWINNKLRAIIQMQVTTLQALVTILDLLSKRPDEQAETIEFYTIINGSLERITHMFLKATERLPLSIKIKDKHNNDAKVDGLPQWALTNESFGGITPSEDGMSAMFVPSGVAGVVQIQVKADADLGEGERVIVGQLEVEVVAGEAMFIELAAGTPEDQSTPAPQEPVMTEPASTHTPGSR